MGYLTFLQFSDILKITKYLFLRKLLHHPRQWPGLRIRNRKIDNTVMSSLWYFRIIRAGAERFSSQYETKWTNILKGLLIWTKNFSLSSDIQLHILYVVKLTFHIFLSFVALRDFTYFHEFLCCHLFTQNHQIGHPWYDVKLHTPARHLIKSFEERGITF